MSVPPPFSFLFNIIPFVSIYMYKQPFYSTSFRDETSVTILTLTRMMLSHKLTFDVFTPQQLAYDGG